MFRVGILRKLAQCTRLDKFGREVVLRQGFGSSSTTVKHHLHTTASLSTKGPSSGNTSTTTTPPTATTNIVDFNYSSDATSTDDRPRFPDPANPFENPLATLTAETLAESQDKRSALPTWTGMKRGQEMKVYERKVNEHGVAYAKGGRKTSFARVKLFEGKGVITVNGRSWVDYFPSVAQRDKILRPMLLLGVIGRFDLQCSVNGGGITGQAEAIRFSLSRALQNWHPQWRPLLKKEGLLRRDSRIVEPKKFGRKKARKSFQWVKR